MTVNWKALLAKTTVWLAAEILLNLLGLDNLADYSEFIFGRQLTDLSQPELSQLMLFTPSSTGEDNPMSWVS
ncbi:hypothetical protein MC7420_4658 [Coleofasciculus chthonoplastes PCC 7420]|uniref:Uncharacterized protein n=1 Tax=Coleofasciculus chthonoplastes PCC 7420 TaxID=118168 RepID=B4VNP6_9CYAN|nr:hypothetical protein [Coleofasciculus chthonoplastes]EDX76402.1 hypothetical protein MC7420_4658 [Coleofasciculus chthonoplastes PCC 7420]